MMVCPICGNKAELVFTLHCSNPKCQNFHKGVLVEPETTLNKRFWESFDHFDCVYFKKYNNDRLEQVEAEYHDMFPGFSKRIGVDHLHGMENVLKGNGYRLTFDCFSVYEGNSIFYTIEDGGDYMWSVIWLQDFDVLKDYR